MFILNTLQRLGSLWGSRYPEPTTLIKMWLFQQTDAFEGKSSRAGQPPCSKPTSFIVHRSIMVK
jgi:hypothetical protein